MKALDILKDLEKLDANMIWLDEDGNGIPMQNVIEAIAELEALENRSCKNCKFNIDFENLTDEEYITLLEKCSKCCIFYDSKWEAK